MMLKTFVMRQNILFSPELVMYIMSSAEQSPNFHCVVSITVVWFFLVLERLCKRNARAHIYITEVDLNYLRKLYIKWY